MNNKHGEYVVNHDIEKAIWDVIRSINWAEFPELKAATIRKHPMCTNATEKQMKEFLLHVVTTELTLGTYQA